MGGSPARCRVRRGYIPAAPPRHTRRASFCGNRRSGTLRKEPGMSRGRAMVPGVPHLDPGRTRGLREVARPTAVSPLCGAAPLLSTPRAMRADPWCASPPAGKSRGLRRGPATCGRNRKGDGRHPGRLDGRRQSLQSHFATIRPLFPAWCQGDSRRACRERDGCQPPSGRSTTGPWAETDLRWRFPNPGRHDIVRIVPGRSAAFERVAKSAKAITPLRPASRVATAPIFLVRPVFRVR